MVVNGIEICIQLFIYNETEEEIGRFWFYDFQEYNIFARQNYRKFKYCKFYYSIVPVKDGKPSKSNRKEPIDFVAIEEYEIKEYIDGFIKEIDCRVT